MDWISICLFIVALTNEDNPSLDGDKQEGDGRGIEYQKTDLLVGLIKWMRR